MSHVNLNVRVAKLKVQVVQESHRMLLMFLHKVGLHVELKIVSVLAKMLDSLNF